LSYGGKNGAQEASVTGLLLVLRERQAELFDFKSSPLLCSKVVSLPQEQTTEEPMDDQCEVCWSTIEIGVGRVEVKVSKVHVLCIICWYQVQPRWYRRIRKYFPLRSIDVALALYIIKDIPKVEGFS
jgi:hypothetical protein